MPTRTIGNIGTQDSAAAHSADANSSAQSLQQADGHIAPLPIPAALPKPAKNHEPRQHASLREQKKERARRLILHSAQHLINAEGYTNTKMRDVAVAANMSYQTLYNYFPTKGLILQELLARDLIKTHKAAASTLESSADLTSKVRALSKTYIDAIAADERALWKEVCAELLKVTSPHSCLLDLLDQNALQVFNETLRRAQNNGELDPHVDSDILAGVLYSLLDSTLMRYLVNQHLTRTSMLGALSAQLRLSITPYLRQTTAD